jgi:hypothetical protein
VILEKEDLDWISSVVGLTNTIEIGRRENSAYQPMRRSDEQAGKGGSEVYGT